MTSDACIHISGSECTLLYQSDPGPYSVKSKQVQNITMSAVIFNRLCGKDIIFHNGRKVYMSLFTNTSRTCFIVIFLFSKLSATLFFCRHGQAGIISDINMQNVTQ